MSELSRFYSAKRRARMKTLNREHCEDCGAELALSRTSHFCLPCEHDRKFAPKPEEIQSMCLEIQQTWSPRERKLREGTLHNRVEIKQIQLNQRQTRIQE